LTAEDFKSASQLLDLLRSKGARSFKGFGIELELAPLVPQEAVVAATLKTAVDETMCRCKHPTYQHGPEGCLYGCDAADCDKAAE
jgi:hypothetical protein